MWLITIGIALAAAVLLLATVSDLISLVRSPFNKKTPGAPSDPPRFLFIVPAHNEEQLIASCVKSLLALRYPPDRFTTVVIADNCTDLTAARARAAGACCVERSDARLPGKPRAIAWALRQLPVDAYDAVVVIDADTMVDLEFAAALARFAPLRHKVLQAYFDVANPCDSALTRMAAVLAAANFRFAYALKRKVANNAPLLGNGMCIGTGVLATHGWRAFTIAEDWELYALYTTAGVPIESAHEARLFAQEAASLRQSTTQRQRWTAGKLTVMIRHLRAVMTSRRVPLWQKIDAAAEMSAPGPVVHLGIAASLTTAIGAIGLPAAGWLMLALWVPIGRLATYALIGVFTQPEPVRAATAFLFLPAYAVWRLWTACTAMKMIGDKPWVRTARR
jgi:cellulose synthase/poly-beta-1,6-N-acetylglucosamine synthase-like glycosyltransferase